MPSRPQIIAALLLQMGDRQTIRPDYLYALAEESSLGQLPQPTLERIQSSLMKIVGIFCEPPEEVAASDVYAAFNLY